MDSDEIIVASSPAHQRDSPMADSPPEVAQSTAESARMPADNTSTALLKPTLPPPKRLKLKARDPNRPAIPPEGIQSPKIVKDDLGEMGFGVMKSIEIAAKKETRLPSGRPLKDSQAESSQRMTTREGRAKGKGKAVTGKAANGYESLALGADTNWVLFDPLRGYSTEILDKDRFALKHSDPPPVFHQYETFKPGNRRILEYNTAYGSVRIRTTPPDFEGREVLYTATGPRLVEAKSKDAAPGRGVGKRRGRQKKQQVIEIKSDDSELSDVDAEVLGD